MSEDHGNSRLRAAMEARFGGAPQLPDVEEGIETLTRMAGRSSCRAFLPEPVDRRLTDLLCAVALSAPSKSDLQQRDIVVVEERSLRGRLDSLIGQGWAADAPLLLVFCGNNRRQRQLHAWLGRPFANDHLDAFFNATVDAAIALAACVTAAEAAGLGCCPLSTIRNRAAEVSDLLCLPDHVFPVAGLALGWPAPAPRDLSMRLPLGITVHRDRFDETSVRERVLDYDRARAALQPIERQRAVDVFGDAGASYGWADDKTRQYSLPERAEFGAFLRARGFRLV
jgi:nitroreductase